MAEFVQIGCDIAIFQHSGLRNSITHKRNIRIDWKFGN